MRTLLLALIACTASASEPNLQPGVTFGSTALTSEGPALAAVFSTDGRAVGIVEPGKAAYWNLTDAKPCGEIPTEIKRPETFCAAASGTLFYRKEDDPKRFFRQKLDGSPAVEQNLPMDLDNLLFSEDLRFAALDDGRWMTVVELETGESQVRLLSGYVRRFSASQSGSTFAFCNRDGEAIVAAAGTAPWRPTPGSGRKFAGVAVSADGMLVALSSYFDDEANARKTAGEVAIWSVAERRKLRDCQATDWFGEYPNRLRFTPDGSKLLAGDGAFIRGWTVADGKTCFAVEPGWNYPGPLVISPDGKHVAVRYQKKVLVWNLETGKMPSGFAAHSGPVWETVFSPDGRYAATTSYGLNTVLVWDARSGSNVAVLNAQFAKAAVANEDPQKPLVVPGKIAMAFHRGSRRLVTVNESTAGHGLVRMWAMPEGTMLWSYASPQKFPPAVAFAGNFLMVAESPKAIGLDLETGKLLWTCAKPLQARGVLASLRGDRAVIASADHFDNAIVNAATGEVIDTCDGIPQCFAPDGGVITLRIGPEMTGGAFHDAVTLRDSKKKEDRQLGKMEMGASKMMMSPDLALRLQFVPGDEPIEIREIEGDQKLCSFAWRRDGAEVNHRNSHFCFSPDHRLFAAVDATGRLTVWDCFSGETVIDCETGCASPHFLTFSPDGNRVFTAGSENGGGPVFGFESFHDQPSTELGASAFVARRAIRELASNPEVAIRVAKQILQPATAEDLNRMDRWLKELDDPAFRVREAASRGLASLGWRIEPKLKVAIGLPLSEEARRRLETILEARDQRPLRAIHLLETVKSPAAVAVLQEVADRLPKSLVGREARRSLARLAAP